MPLLHSAGWASEQIVEQHPITDGRILPSGRGHRRLSPLFADYVLEYAPGVPVAVVEAKRKYKLPSAGLQQGIRYAQMLDLPLAFSTNGSGIVAHDFTSGAESVETGFLSPAECWARFREFKGLTPTAQKLIEAPFNRELRLADGSVKVPRYYQRVAIDRIHAAMAADHRRLLVTMATGTGKTFVALQVAWKLWREDWPAGRKPRILYLADRSILIDQPMKGEFIPVFGDAVWKIRGEPKTSREIYFALYQALADSGDALGVFRSYAPDFFDLVIVDECHRGSARDGSSWRAILDYFSSAVQLGLTATPKRDDNIDTYNYFGEPLFTYSLAQGIEDGFLAPYRVRRVVLSPDAYGFAPSGGQLDIFGREVPPGLYETHDFERVVSLLSRTRAAAHHLSEYLARTDPMAKTVVFCVDQEHADQMRLALQQENQERVRQFPNYVARIVSDEGDVGGELLGQFADKESDEPVIVTTSRLLSTGVDLPAVKNVVLFKPIGSIVDFKQTIGRGTRICEDVGKLSFEILDYAGATRLFEDLEFDGPPERVLTETVDENGDRETEEGPSSGPESSTGSDDPYAVGDEGGEAAELLDPDYGDGEVAGDEGPRREKLYVDGIPVYLVAEGYRILDPETGKLRLIEYTQYVSEQVRSLFGGRTDLLEGWRSSAGRQEIEALLSARGVFIKDLTARPEFQQLDPLDVLALLAWSTPATSRQERVRRVKAEHEAYLGSFQPQARDVLEVLLQKYAEFGVGELEDLNVLEVAPLNEIGTPVQIAALFGGPEALKAAIQRLEELVYAA